jgi:hypothetical protein
MRRFTVDSPTYGIVHVELILSNPVFMTQAVSKCIVTHNLGSICDCSAQETWYEGETSSARSGRAVGMLFGTSSNTDGLQRRRPPRRGAPMLW